MRGRQDRCLTSADETPCLGCRTRPEPSAQKADGSGLLFFGQHLDVGQPCGIDDGPMNLVVANACGAALFPFSCDAVVHLPKAARFPLLLRSLRLDGDVNEIFRHLPLVALNRWFVVQISQPPQP